MSSARLKAWPKHEQGGAAQYKDLGAALKSTYRGDAHFAAYSAPTNPRRLETKAAEQIRISMVAVIFDVDGANHKATPEWWASEKDKLVDLLRDHPGAYVYKTRGGYRIVYSLERRIFIADAGRDATSDRIAWRALYLSWCAYLARRYGIEADRGCKDWTRLFRLPHATRDEGGQPEQLETIGDVDQIGAWHCQPGDVDMQTAVKHVREPIKHTDDASRTSSKADYAGRGRLLEAFAGRGWLDDDEIEPGKYPALCPWNDSHSTGRDYDGSTVIWQAERGRGDLGVFHCSHSHCEGRSTKEVIAVFSDEEMGNKKDDRGSEVAAEVVAEEPRRIDEAQIRAERERSNESHYTATEVREIPTLTDIDVRTEEHEVVTEAIEVLAAADRRLFQQAGRLVQVVRIPLHVNDREAQADVPQIASVSSANLRNRMTRYARFISRRGNKRTGELEIIVTHPPKWLPEAVLSTGEWHGIRVLEAIAEAPTLRPDGTILDKPGYDASTRLLYEPTDTFLPMPQRPTLVDAQRACAELCEVVADFPIDRENRAAWLAATLTAFARHAIAGPVPLFLIDKNVRGAGAGLMADASAILATGRPAPVTVMPENDEEMAKVITSLVMAGVSLVLIDNVTGVLGGAALDAALTGRTHRGRILGRSEMTGELPLKIVFWATANNAQIGGDTVRRICRVRLESLEERPEERQDFQHADLRAWVRAERGRLVRAALTILRAYCGAGRPDMHLKPWGSYEAWSALIRGALVWTGEPDPAAHRAELASQSDGEAAALAALLDGLEIADPASYGLTTSEILRRASGTDNDYEGLREAIGEIAPTRDGKPPTPKSLGRRLLHLRKRVVDGRYLERVQAAKATRWAVGRIQSEVK